MKNIWTKVSIIIIMSILGFFYVIPWQSIGLQNPLNNLGIKDSNYKLGLDLKGGIELDYKINLNDRKKELGYDKKRENEIIEQLKLIVDKRISSLGIDDSVITTASYSGEQHIIVQIPLKGKNLKEDKENIQRVKAAVGKVVKIMFKEKREGEITQKDFEERKNIALKLLEEEKKSKYNFFVVADQFRDSYDRVYDGTISLKIQDFKNIFKDIEIKKGLIDKIIEVKKENIGKIKDSLNKNLDDYFAILNIKNIGKENIEAEYAIIAKTPSEWIPAKDSKGRVLDDNYFKKAGVTSSQLGEPEVELIFNTQGGKIFGELTKRISTRFPNNQIAIFVGGEMLTAPNVEEAIYGGRAVINGKYTPKSAEELANNINTGVIPAPIYLTSEKTIDSKLGGNALEKLIKAGFVGFLLIFVFLMLIYRISGLSASLALIIYTILVLVIIKFFGNILTLASIAGLILSIGIAIDANILIFERIKDEFRDKPDQDFQKSIQIGFDNSWSAIWDSNITGLIISIILYIFGVNMIKGFGLMLGIGIVVSLFTAMWVSRIFLLAIGKNIKNKNLFIGFNK